MYIHYAADLNLSNEYVLIFCDLYKMELYQNRFMTAFFCCGNAETAFVHAALPHKTASLRLCQNKDRKKMYFDTTPIFFTI
jgi:hypothetical protein